MIDIFEDITPKVYCVDMVVNAMIPSRGKNKELRIIKLYSEPITLLNGKLASKKIKERLFKKIHKEKIKKGEYGGILFEIKDIKVKHFLTDICYKFDYTDH